MIGDIVVIVFAILIGGTFILYKVTKPKDTKTKSVYVKSLTNRNRRYLVTPELQTCSCKDWTERRASFSKNDPRRFCKHMTICYEQSAMDLPRDMSPFEGLILHFGLKRKGIPLGANSESVVVASQSHSFSQTGFIVIQMKDGDEWLSLYTSSLKYGFNTRERRWSYDNYPEFAHELEKHVKLMR